MDIWIFPKADARRLSREAEFHILTSTVTETLIIKSDSPVCFDVKGTDDQQHQTQF